MAFNRASIKNLSAQQKVIALLAGITILNLTIVLALWLCYSSSMEATKYLFAGLARAIGYDVDRSDWDDDTNRKTVEETNRVLAKDRNNAEALKQRANALSHLGEYKRALADYDRLVMIEPTEVKWQKGRAKQFRDMNNYADAIATDTLAIKMDRSWRTLLLRAEDYVDNKQNALAIKDLEESEKYPEKDSDTQESDDWYVGNSDARRAELYRRMRMPEKAFAFNKKFIDSQKEGRTFNLSPAYEKLAEYWINKDEYAKALENLDQQVKDQSYVESGDQMRKAALLLALNRKKEADTVYEKVFEEESKNEDRTDKTKGHSFSSVTAATKSLRLYRRLHGQSGLLEFRKRCIDDVRKYVDRKNARTDFAEYKINLKDACTFIEMVPKSEGQELARYLRRQIIDYKNDDSLNLQLALAYYLDDLNEVDRLCPADSPERDSHFYHQKALYLCNRNNAKDALPLAEKSLTLGPDLTCGLLAMAQVQIARGDAAAAQKYLDQAKINDDNNNSTGLWDQFYLQSKIYRLKGKAAEADHYLRRAVADNDNDAIDDFLKLGK